MFLKPERIGRWSAEGTPSRGERSCRRRDGVYPHRTPVGEPTQELWLGPVRSRYGSETMSQASKPNEVGPEPREAPAPQTGGQGEPHPAIPQEDDPEIEKTEEQPS